MATDFGCRTSGRERSLGFSSAVACFATHSREAVVVCSRGLVMRVPLPRRELGREKSLNGGVRGTVMALAAL